MQARASTAAPVAATADRPPNLYLFGPAIDLAVIAGGLTFVLFPISLVIAPQLNAIGFLVLLFFCNYPHYMATNYRIYRNRSQIERYKIFSIYITGLLGLTAILGHFMASFSLQILYTVYFTWSPFHYSGQNYGVALLYLRRSGTEPSKSERWMLYCAFSSCFLMYVAYINADVGSATAAYPFHSLGLPRNTVRVVYLFLLAGGAASAIWFLIRIVPRTPRPALTPVLLLMGSQFAWFAAATGVPLFAKEMGLDWVPIGALFPAIAFLHCAQYLGVTAYYAKRDSVSEKRAFSAGRYFAALVVGGVFLWLGSTRLLSQVFGLDYGVSFLLMLSLINIHHFLMDGAIWKLRDGKLARLLIGPASVAAEAALPRHAKQKRKPPREAGNRETIESSDSGSVWKGPAWAVAGVAALALGGTDLYYRIGMARGNEAAQSGDPARAVAYYTSVWSYNGRSSEALDGLAYWDLNQGRVADAVARWERSLELNPTATSAYAHIGLGEAYLRLGRADDAFRHLQKAIELRPSEPSSYTLMASVYESRGDHAKAAEMRKMASASSPQAGARPASY